MGTVMYTIDEMKNRAKILKEYLRAGGFNITQSSCYNALAKMHGFENWNIFQDYLKKQEKK